MYVINRLVVAAALLALVPACASNSGPGGSGQNYAGRHRTQSAPQSTPYADPLFDSDEDAAKSQYVLANLKDRQRVYWYNAKQDKIYFLSVKVSSAPETGRPKEIEIATKKPDGRVVLLSAKARLEGDKWKVYTPFVAPLDDNGQKLLEANYKEAYRRATAPPEKPAPKPAAKQGGKQTAAQAAKPADAAAPREPSGAQAQGGYWTLPEGAPEGLVAANDFDFPVVSPPKAQKPADAPAGGKRGRHGGGGGGGMGGMGSGSGGGVMGGPGGMGGM